MVDPVSGYPCRGLEPGPEARALPPLVHAVDRDRPVDGAAREHRRRPGRHAVPLPRARPSSNLTHLVRSLREDQHDPRLSARDLLGNFLDLATGKRLGPLASEVDEAEVPRRVRPRERARRSGRPCRRRAGSSRRTRTARPPSSDRPSTARITSMARSPPTATNATQQKIMAILDQRVVMVVFGDNANLSASVAKTIGALLGPRRSRTSPGSRSCGGSSKQFLERQQEGYARLYDAKVGPVLLRLGCHQGPALRLGRPARELDDRPRGLPGQRVPRPGHVRRAPVRAPARCDQEPRLQDEAVPDAGRAGLVRRWPRGRARRSRRMGLELCARRSSDRPSWRQAPGERRRRSRSTTPTRNELARLPVGVVHAATASSTPACVGIPEITVSPRPRITDAASLYTLGAAYSIAPEKVEQFLAANWPVVSRLLTDHGPWEGFNASRHEVIRFQTTAHTISLILGLLGTASEHMKRYLDGKGLVATLDEVYRPGAGAELFPGEAQVFAWNDRGIPIQFDARAGRLPRDERACQQSRDRLRLGPSRRREPLGRTADAPLPLHPPDQPGDHRPQTGGGAGAAAGLIPTEITCRFADTARPGGGDPGRVASHSRPGADQGGRHHVRAGSAGAADRLDHQTTPDHAHHPGGTP